MVLYVPFILLLLLPLLVLLVLVLLLLLLLVSSISIRTTPIKLTNGYLVLSELLRKLELPVRRSRN
jgi:hypothetical protein